MDDMTAFERQLSGEFEDLMGPERPVDDLAVFDAVVAADRSPRWGSTMSSAFKFAAAAVVIALFGGLLLAGVLRMPEEDEVLPAAVPASPSPMMAEGLPLGMTTEEVEPGVYRVEHDGVRELSFGGLAAWDIVAGQDDGIWLLMREGGGFFRLGNEGSHAWAWEGDSWDWQDSAISFDVAPDGTPWAVLPVDRYGPDGSTRPSWAVVSHDGETWTEHQRALDVRALLDVTPDGRVWTAWLGDPADSRSSRPGYLDDDGWQAIEGLSRGLGPYVSDSGDLWATDGHVGQGWAGMLHRYVDGAWSATDRRVFSADVGPDGTLWALDDAADVFYRFDGDTWQEWSLDHSGSQPLRLGPRLPYGVGPDGSLWAGWWVRSGDGDPGECDGIGRFDGTTWVRYLDGLCIEAMDITADGSVWVLAWPPDGVGPYGRDDTDVKTQPYVITSEAVAAAG